MDRLTGSLHISAARFLLCLCLAASAIASRLGGRLHYATVKRQDSETTPVLALRGGSTLNFNLGGEPTKPVDAELDLTGTTPVLVSTSFGSMFLDKKKKLVLGKNETISDLKAQLSTKFPGSPPVELQHLYFSSRRLEDWERIGNISSLSPVPIMLDMMSGTSVYNKSMSVSQGLEAYVASVTQQAYLGTQLRELHSPPKPEGSNSTEGLEGMPMSMETLHYRQLFHAVNDSIYSRYAEDIAAALEEEREPETFMDDTAAWRGKTANVNPLAAAIAKEFDLNWRSFRHFLYYSAVLTVFALFGTTTDSSAKVLLCMIPLLWISKLRQLRLIFKIAQYLVLPVIPHMDFLLPLLPAPLQVIAHNSQEWSTEAMQEDINVVASKWASKMKGRKSDMQKQDLKESFRAAKLKTYEGEEEEEEEDEDGGGFENEGDEEDEDEDEGGEEDLDEEYEASGDEGEGEDEDEGDEEDEGEEGEDEDWEEEVDLD